MVQYNPLQMLPNEEDLPYTDNQPVDNELQRLIPYLLRAILAHHWAERNDWFLGVNLGLYYAPDQPAVRPDGFLSLGVERVRSTGKLRLSYLLWKEQVVPQWVLEIVSDTPGGEYDRKFQLYAEIGVLYYTIYNPDRWRRDKHDPFEVYRLVDGSYVRQAGNPIWMPEVGLGIGCEQGTYEGLTRDWLYWYDEQGQRLLSPREQLEQEHQRAEQERRLREDLLDRLRQRGINPDDL